MAPQDQGIVLGRIICSGPDNELRKCLWIGHVLLPDACEIRTDYPRIVVPDHLSSRGITGAVLRTEINLYHDIDVIARTDHLHLIDIIFCGFVREFSHGNSDESGSFIDIAFFVF